MARTHEIPATSCDAPMTSPSTPEPPDLYEMLRDAIEDFLQAERDAGGQRTNGPALLSKETVLKAMEAVDWLYTCRPGRVTLFANLFEDEHGVPKVRVLHKVRLRRNRRRRTVVAQWHPLKELLKGEGLEERVADPLTRAVEHLFKDQIVDLASRMGTRVRDWRDSEQGREALRRRREAILTGLRAKEGERLKEAMRPLSKSGWTGDMVMEAWREVLVEGIMDS